MKLTKKIAFLFGYSFPLLTVLGYHQFGWTYTGVLYGYVLIPLLDELVGKDPHNVLRLEFEDLVNDRYFDVLVYSHVYIQYGLLIWGGWVLTFEPLTLVEQIGLVLSLGVYASSIINIAHELGHRQSTVAKLHSQAALLTVGYMHFFIEHNRGHHVHVATPQDPATSKQGQTVFAFWKQTLLGSYRSAWHIEQRRLEREGKPLWSYHNAMLWYGLLPLLLAALLTGLFSVWAGRVVWVVAVFWLAQALIAVLSLECVNYIEHYGIVRREIAPGKYERVNPLHSWNANHFISNLMLFQLQRHSDHHAFASRPYQVLRHFDESPQLPFGYPVMILMSTVPPLWFWVMDKRLEAWRIKAYDAEHITQVVKQFA